MAAISYDGLIAKLTLQKANIPTYTSDVGATLIEVNDINNDLANLEYAGDYSDVVDENKKTCTQIKQALFNGDENIPVAVYPSFSVGELPEDAKAGALQRFIDRGKRWKTSNGWTPEIGTALGYDGPAPKPVPGTVKPSIEAFAAAANSHFSLVVSNRGEATMWDVYILRKGGNWTKVDTASGKSADIHVTLTTPGEAEQIQVRVQLRKNNEDYGQLSDPVYVTLNP
ncbi:MAG TPA: hypothetical protein PKA82_17705 [Pyrinomonadaceae bacterium]|nr:hypothetical protein [Pyrinomonadaceae bacterium]